MALRLLNQPDNNVLLGKPCKLPALLYQHSNPPKPSSPTCENNLQDLDKQIQ